MGDSVEQWRAAIGHWGGGRPQRCVTSQHHIAQTSNHIGYKYIRFLVLLSLLVIGCVELNPGPDHETAAPTQINEAIPKFLRRKGSSGVYGGLYEVKMAEFLFARALYKTEEFKLASNVAGAGAFDDLVFRYRLRESDVWKTCFIQLKHKDKGGAIMRSSLTQISGDFSLLKYFKSFCEIKSNSAEEHKLKECGPFDDFVFVIYTNGKVESKSPLQGGDSDPLSILSSGEDCGRYITFDKTHDKDIFGFFEDLSKCHKLIGELESQIKSDKEIQETIEKVQNLVTNRTILRMLKGLESKVKTDKETTWINDIANCDFNLFQEFLKKVKIFNNQINIEFVNGLIIKELQKACKASLSVANSIHTKFVEGFSKWLKKDGNVVWLNENSELWQAVQEHIISEINEISERETREIIGCDTHFTQQHVQKLSDAIAQNTVLNIVTNSKIRNLQKLKTFQALKDSGYKNSLFINMKSLILPRKDFRNFWPCKWSDVLVVDCGSDGNVAHTVLESLQQSADCEERFDTSDDNTVEPFVDVLQKYQQKVIFISTRQEASRFQEKLRNISYFVDNCDISDLDENSQKKILERTIKFQGTDVALTTLVGTDHPDSIKALLDSDAISILLSNEHELTVGRELSDLSKYYVPRVLQHQIYLKEDILKLADYAVAFAISGLQAEELKNYLPAGEKIYEFVYDERERNHNFKIVSDFFKSGFSAELENTKTYIEAEQNIKPEEVRYIILGNKNPNNEIRELKNLLRNIHWIHVENWSFLWRESNCNIDIIRTYIDTTKCKKYDMKCVLEHNDRTMLLVAEPGMGKSTFLSYLPHEIKKCKTSIWVLRINLIEHTIIFKDTDFENEYIDQCKMFLWSAAHSPEQDALKVTKKMFLQAMEETGRMVIILDGFDEISPDYSGKVKKIISVIRDETAAKIWISSRFSYRQELEDFVGQFAFTLQPFTSEDQVRFLEKYWIEVTEISNKGDLQMFAKELLTLCSQNFSDEDGEFTGIPLQTMMLGEAFVNEAKEYCCSGEFNLPERFNLIDLFQKFTEKKFQIYFGEKNEMDISKPEVKIFIEDYLEKHMISALLFLFPQKEMNELLGAKFASNLEQTKCFLGEGKLQKFGIIREIEDGKPHFIHRCFAEYFAAKWFHDNFRKCEEFISKLLFNTTNEVIRKFFDRMLAEGSDIHYSVLNNDTSALKELLKKETDINTLDKGGRTALHLAASYNSPYIQQLLSLPGIDTKQTDAFLKWTPLKYADRTKSWMAMDILLQNGANPDDIVFTRQNVKAQEWGQAALWECASNGHIKLLEFMLNCGHQLNAHIEVHENLHEKYTILHRASYCGQVEVVRLIVNRGADINIRDANNNTALHFAAESGKVDIINLLIDKGMSVNLTNTNDSTPLHVSVQFGHLEATTALVERGAALNSTNKYGNTPLLTAAHKGKLELFRYLKGKGADINICNKDDNTALHLASASGSLDIIKLLLDKGMPVNLKNKPKFTPLHVSARFGHLEATKILVERGAAVDCTNEYDHTPLMVAAYYDKLEIFRYLIDNGADIHFRNDDNNTAIRYAAKSGNVEMIKLLLDKGMSVNATDKKKSTPLHVTAQFGHLEATKLLVERGAALNHKNKCGNTPLMIAAYKCKLDTFRYLTDKGADINIRDHNNNTALHYAAESGSVAIIKLLLDKGMSVNLTDKDDNTPLHVSAYFGHREATRLLVASCAAINDTNKNGRTPLMMAAYTGKLEIFRYLTGIGADINICDSNNNTALHIASFSGSVDIIKSLLDKGMSVNSTNTHEFTPLHVSAEFGHLEATKTLVERGAAITNTINFGDTPLMLAAYKGKLEIFRYLTEIGTEINIRDANNNTALHFASASGNVDIIMSLLDKGMSVNLTNTDECTPLHFSAEFGQLEATKTLVERGTAINKTNKYGNTPLMVAVYNDKLELCRYLTGKGADINICGFHNNY